MTTVLVIRTDVHMSNIYYIMMYLSMFEYFYLCFVFHCMSIKAGSKLEGDWYLKNNITMYLTAASEGLLVSPGAG